jgi:hypothetical protein
MRRDSPSPYWDALLTSLIRLPSLMMGAASIYQLGVRAICLKLSYSSHRPNGIFTCFALVLAGRRCLRRKWHGDHLIVHHQWQLSWTGTCKPCLQIPRMQTSHCLCACPNSRLHYCEHFGQLQYVRAAETWKSSLKFPSPRGNIADVLASTLACTTANDALVNYRTCVSQ